MRLAKAAAEGVVHDLDGLKIGRGDGYAEAVGEERGLRGAGFVDERRCGGLAARERAGW